MNLFFSYNLFILCINCSTMPQRDRCFRERKKMKAITVKNVVIKNMNKRVSLFTSRSSNINLLLFFFKLDLEKICDLFYDIFFHLL